MKATRDMLKQKENKIAASYLRMPPQDIEAEMSVLGALMIDGNVMAQVADILNPEDFYREDHKMVYDSAAICSPARRPLMCVPLPAG